MHRSHARLLIAAAVGSLLAASASAQTLKIATVVPDGSSWMREMRRTADEIRTQTEGRVKLKFYPGGVMGNDKTVLRKIRIGQLHGGAFTSGSLTQLYPDADLYSLPLVFRSFDEVDYVRERMDSAMREGLKKADLVVLSLLDGGFAHLLSQKPVRTTADLKGTKVWVLEDDAMSRKALEIAGVSPVPLPVADVYTGLQTGLIDTVAAPPMAAIAFQWHTKVKYFTDVPLMYLVGVLAVDRRAFQRLRLGDRERVRELVAAATRRLDRESRLGHERAKQVLLEQGIESVAASSPEEVMRWHAIAEAAVRELRGSGVYSEELIDALLAHLDSYRGQLPAAHGR